MRHPFFAALQRGIRLTASRLRTRRTPAIVIAIVTAGTMQACRDRQLTAPDRVAVERASLTGQAARSIDTDGQFRIEHAVGAGEIDAATARRIAAAFWHDNASFLITIVDRDRGAPVQAAQLHPCERVFFVRSAYDGVPADASTALRKAVGSHWIVGMCNGDVEEVAIAVSATATDVRLGAGRVQLLEPGDANFFVMGVPVGTQIPMAPETIADFSAKNTGRRVSLVPELVMRPHPNSPMVALWQITLESPTRVLGATSKESRDREVLFAGPANGWAAPALADAAGGSLGSDDVDLVEARDAKGGSRQLKLKRRAGVPRQAELVSLESR